MEFITSGVSILLNIDAYLALAIDSLGGWIYGLLFLILFAETGLVFTPFLPGDSLIFAAGALSAQGMLGLFTAWFMLTLGTIIGDSTNFWIGKKLGIAILAKYTRILKQEHLDQTNAFYDKYGMRTIIIGRFVPFVRTFAPFVAGLSSMRYRDFVKYSIAGSLLWVTPFILAGYFFGALNIVRNNFSMVIYSVIVITTIPPIWSVIRAKYFSKTQ